MTRLFGVLLLCVSLFGQEVPDNERADLRAGLSEAGSSQVEFIRAIERHLQKYPQTAQRPELERALVKAATEVRDTRRILIRALELTLSKRERHLPKKHGISPM